VELVARPTSFHPSDLHGAARLAADATVAVTDIVEAMHEAAIRLPLVTKSLPTSRVGGIPGLAYSSVRGIAGLVGGGIELALKPLLPLLAATDSSPQRDAVIGVLNGVVGDHLAETDNSLAVPMEFRRSGKALPLERRALATALPQTSPRIAVFVHGLCGTDGQWKGGAVDYAARLERELGFTPVYLCYNSGRHISSNGRDFALSLDTFLAEWPVPVEELLLVGHSMGGLVARSALHYGTVLELSWPAKLRRIAFLGTPHHGAPLERGGHWFEVVMGTIPYAAPLSRLGRLRSAGITDLRHGNIVDQDRNRVGRFDSAHDTRCVPGLPRHVECVAVAATMGERRGDARDRLVGDGLVPVASALGHHRKPEFALGVEESRCLVVHRTHHMALLGHPAVADFLVEWIEGGTRRQHPADPDSGRV
jgi:pimeloyl-ACP methyl ester carboxylesterase